MERLSMADFGRVLVSITLETFDSAHGFEDAGRRFGTQEEARDLLPPCVRGEQSDVLPKDSALL